MNHSANAAQRTTHGPGSKPRTIVPTRPRRDSKHLAACQAEGKALQQAARLTADLNDGATPEQRAAHANFMTGYLTALEASGLVPAQRLCVLHHAINQLLDGNITLGDLRAMKKSGHHNDTDATYLRAVSLVNRDGLADPAKLAQDMFIDAGTARALLDRMQADGMINPPDMFGVRTLAAGEVSHG